MTIPLSSIAFNKSKVERMEAAVIQRVEIPICLAGQILAEVSKYENEDITM